MTKVPGAMMRSEINEAPDKFANMLGRDLGFSLTKPKAIYTIARGSSDAAANVLSYEFMAELGIPMTTLPPSVFSLGNGVDMAEMTGLVISQSGGSSDLVKAGVGVKARGGAVVVLTNTAQSPASEIADICIDMQAGPELAIPATKSVVSTIAAGMALLAVIKPEYASKCKAASVAMNAAKGQQLPNQKALEDAIIASDSIYFIGRGSGFGAAQEIALKFKECAAIHAEAFSSSEVLHGPLQLATKPLTAIILDTEEPEIQDSLDEAERRFKGVNAPVFRIKPSDLGAHNSTPAAAAAVLIYALYEAVLNVTLRAGLDPDAPETLAKVTDTI